jgi:hypothetical protein
MTLVLRRLSSGYCRRKKGEIIIMKEITATIVLEVPQDLDELDFCVQIERMVNDRADFEFVKISNYSEK